MNQDQLKDVGERDQLWASLRELADEIDRLAAGEVDSSERQKQLSVLLARIVAAELRYRAAQ